MKVLVTGSSGHLGEALMRVLNQENSPHQAIGVDLIASHFTHHAGDIADRSFVTGIFEQHHDLEAVLHVATLHKPHVETHSRQAFVDTNITGTLNLLEEATQHALKAFVLSSTTSVFGELFLAPETSAVYITEKVSPKPKNIYGVTKLAAEDLCRLMHRLHNLPCLVLRTSRFFLEPDDQISKRSAYRDDANLKTNEFLYRRVDIADIVDAHLLALDKAASIGFDVLHITSTTPFRIDDCQELSTNGAAVVARLFPEAKQLYDSRDWCLPQSFDRVYSNDHARAVLDWQPKYDFAHHLDCLRRDQDPRSPLAQTIRPKGYHGGQVFEGGKPFPAKQET